MHISVSKSAPLFTDMFKMDSFYIIYALSFISLPATFQLNEAGMLCHSVICRSRSAITDLEHARFHSSHSIHFDYDNTKSVFVCVEGGIRTG